LGITLSLPLLIGIWLPDVITAQHHTRHSNGSRADIPFAWCNIGTASISIPPSCTSLHPAGRTEVHTLDGDDSKSWRLPFRIDEQRRTATVVLDGGRIKTVDW
jgi:hypothetical protein